MQVTWTQSKSLITEGWVSRDKIFQQVFIILRFKIKTKKPSQQHFFFSRFQTLSNTQREAWKSTLPPPSPLALNFVMQEPTPFFHLLPEPDTLCILNKLPKQSRKLGFNSLLEDVLNFAKTHFSIFQVCLFGQGIRIYARMQGTSCREPRQTTKTIIQQEGKIKALLSISKHFCFI